MICNTKRLTNGRKPIYHTILKGSGMSIGNMNIYNPKGIKYTDDDIKQIMEDKQYVIFHITGNDSKLKKILNKINYSTDGVRNNLIDGFYWYNMPEYVADTKVYPVVYVGFFNDSDKLNFFKQLEPLRYNDKIKWYHYPKPIPNKNDTMEYKITYKINPKYPVYVISKGRWKSRMTSRALEEDGIPYKIVIEEQEYNEYSKVIDSKKILILPKSYIKVETDKFNKRSSIPARNFVWSHAVNSGAKKHWILDDNIDGWYRWNLNHRWKIHSGVLFKLIEDYVERFTNILQAGMNYRMFYPSRQPRPPITFNTRVYSCMLNDHRIDKLVDKIRWKNMNYNEDTDLSLRILKKGYGTALFNAFLCGKAATLTVAGGNTDNLYKKGESNTIKLKAQALVNEHPDVAKVVEKYKRGFHHYVDYSKFKKNNLGYKNPKVYKGVNEYNMKLVKIKKE